jgi:CubicO group peptidase (beta-lactamase class C family)
MYGATRESPISRPGFIRHRFRLILCAGVAVLLTACGGGGGGGGSNPPPSGGGNPPPPPPPPPTNQAPTANAGTDQNVEMPFAASLSGSGTDPETAAASLTYAWTGPSGVTFSAPSAAATEARFAAAGSYELTLTVGDGTATHADTVLITVAAAVFPAADTSDTVPDRGWLRVTPDQAGMSQALLEQAATFAQSSPAPAGPGAGMVVRRGRLVFSWGDIDRPRDVKSVTKSMGGIALGIALDEDRVELEDFAAEHEPRITTVTPPGNDARTQQVTMLQLATHTAGFEKQGGYRPLIHDPGTTWRYSDGGLNWLADALTNVFDADLLTFTGTRVWGPLGLDYGINDDGDDVRWRDSTFRPDDRGTGLTYRELASGIDANVNAMARVGLLFLRRGMWNDQRILSEAFVDLVQTPRSEVASAQNPLATTFPGATTDYGVLWWTNKTGQLANVPRDAYWAWGLGEALIVVIPSLDLVIARNGGQFASDSSPDRTWNDFTWDGRVSVLAPFLDPIVDAVN